MEIILAGVPILLGIGFIWTKVSKVVAVLKEVTELLVKVTGALEDKRLTPEEIQVIKKEAIDVAVAAKAVFS